MQKLESHENDEAPPDRGYIHGTRQLAEPLPRLSFTGEVHAKALIERKKYMLAHAVYQKPDKHD
jgi:hypothetical protein